MADDANSMPADAGEGARAPNGKRADSPLEMLQDCHTRWMEIEELIFAAAVAANDVNEIDRERVLMGILHVTERLAKDLGDRFAHAVVALGGRA